MIRKMATVYGYTRDWLFNLGWLKKLRAERYAMELTFLQSQVDPQFLFNSLNNLCALALDEGSPKTADGIAKLGTLMRYNLQDAQAELVPLSKEINYLEKYIELQQLHTSPQTELEFNLQINKHGQYEGEKIAPMLLIPFVENAFKYGLSSIVPTRIYIGLALSNDRLLLNVENDIVSMLQDRVNKGFGLETVKKRLALRYPGRHELLIREEDGVFMVRLEIDLRS